MHKLLVFLVVVLHCLLQPSTRTCGIIACAKLTVLKNDNCLAFFLLKIAGNTGTSCLKWKSRFLMISQQIPQEKLEMEETVGL